MDRLSTNSKLQNPHKIKHLKNTGDTFISRRAGAIQAQINLRLLARFHLGPPLFSSSTYDTYSNTTDWDCGELHVSNSHYYDLRGDRGGAIKFICKVKRLPPIAATAYLEGWLDSQAGPKAVEPDESPPVQLNLFALLKESVCP